MKHRLTRLSTLLNLATNPTNEVEIRMERGFDHIGSEGQHLEKYRANDSYTFVVKVNGGAEDRT